MALGPDTQLGPYRIIEPIGKGGMGEVYRARDTKLDRDVAIKVIPDFYARDPERVARFQREAKVLASLNHPNIAAIYGFEEVEGKQYLVMELVEGDTLSDRLKQGRMPLEDTLSVGSQIAEALETAHESGVIHRDLKPANVKITPDGKVKVLDFGLAKAFAAGGDASQTDVLNSPTITAQHSPTAAGVILGTAAYMSPEQARGKPIDKRTDIWSFGCVLYECLGGRRPFEGETTTDTLAKVLEREPDWTALAADTPPTIQLLLRRCLAKDRTKRLRDIGDAKIELDNAIADPTGSSLRFADTALSELDKRSKAKSYGKRHWAVTLVLVAIAAVAGWALKPSPAPRGRIAVEVSPPEDSYILFVGDLAGPAAVSPDGTMVAFVAKPRGKRRQLWLRRLDENKSKPLRGTERATFPFWSPDSRSIGFFPPAKLKRIDLATGTTISICDAVGGRGGTWLSNDVIVFSPDYQTGLASVSASGGKPAPITELDAAKHTSHRWPARIGDGNHFLYSAVNHDPGLYEHSAIYLGSLDGSPPRRIIQSLLNAEYASGHMLFVRDTVLMAVSLDVPSGSITGDPVAIVGDVTPDLSTWHAAFSVTSSGVLAYHSVASVAAYGMDARDVGLGVGVEANVTVLYDRSGRPFARVADGIPQVDLRFSPDGKQLAICTVSENQPGVDIWLFRDAPDAKAKRITSMPYSERMPVWSPDGAELAFSHMFVGDGPDAIYRKRIGGGVEHKLVEADGSQQIWPTDWSRDGKYLIYSTGTFILSESSDIHVLPLDGGKPFPYIATPGNERGGRVSPNGNWLAYVGGKENTPDVFVVPFAPRRENDASSLPTQRWQISVGGGIAPSWGADGKELYYIADQGTLVAVSVETEGEIFSVGAATQLIETAFEPGKSYDVSPDGQIIAINEISINVDTTISLIINWNTALDQ